MAHIIYGAEGAPLCRRPFTHGRNAVPAACDPSHYSGNQRDGVARTVPANIHPDW